MLKKMKKAFTITELVIVIAVIAILAAVLIPTFTTVVNKANESAAMQEARSEFENFNVEVLTSESDIRDFVIKCQKGEGADAYYFVVTDGQFNPTPVKLDANDPDDPAPANQIKVGGDTYTKLADPAGQTGNKFNNYAEQNSNVTIYVLGADGAATTETTEEGAGA